MGVEILDPRGFTAREWTDRMVLNLEAFGQLPRIDRDEDWRTWALLVSQFPAIAATNPPNPIEFEDWQSWAMRFIQIVNLAPTS